MNKLLVPNDLLLGEVSRMLNDGHKVVIMTKGVSMLPFIVGDRDSVELEKRDSYRIGDIVLARVENKRWVLHRLVSMEWDKAVLKGDGNLVGIERCAIGDIAGAVTFIIRPKGKTDCSSRKFARKSRRWKELPYIVRRIILGIYRRLI